MRAELSGVRVLGVGAWEIDGQAHRYVDVYDPDGRDSQSIRFGIHKDVPDVELEFGDVIDVVCDLSQETKVVRGADRTVSRHRMQIREVRKAGGGRAEKPVRAAA